jgi:hypothetical protein
MLEYRQIRMEETLTKWYLHLTRNVEKNGCRAERNTEGSPDTSTPRVEGKFNMTDKHGEGRGAEKREGRRRTQVYEPVEKAGSKNMYEDNER